MADLKIHDNSPDAATARTPMPEDTRGIVDPAAMMRRVRFERAPAGDELDGVVEWFWSVAWDLPDGIEHDQQVISHPAGNLSIGTVDDDGIPLDPAEGRVYGVSTRLSHRRLTASGWTVAARTAVGGLGVLLGGPAVAATDARLELGAVTGPVADRLVRDVATASGRTERVDLLRSALGAVVATRPAALRAEAGEVVAVAAIAERDRSVCRAEQLAALAGTSLRTLQRLFDRHVGVSPSFVIRRWRIIEAAEAARVAIDGGGDWPGWATVAADLGYADQAHLTRDFRRHLGISPSAYLAQATRPG